MSDGIMAKYLVDNSYGAQLTRLFMRIHANGKDSMAAVRNLNEYIPDDLYTFLKDMGSKTDALSHEQFSMELLKLYDGAGGDRSNLDMKFVMALPDGTRRRSRNRKNTRKNRKNSRKNNHK